MKRRHKLATARRGFTLIELLVVIAIMLLLMSVLFPAYNNARRTAQRNAATIDIHNIKAAIVAYHREYGRYPLQTSAQAPQYTHGDYKALIDILRGNSTGNRNPRNIQFLDVSESAHDDSHGMVDPWGQPYRISVDASKNTVIVSSQGNPDSRFREELTTE